MTSTTISHSMWAQRNAEALARRRFVKRVSAPAGQLSLQAGFAETLRLALRLFPAALLFVTVLGV